MPASFYLSVFDDYQLIAPVLAAIAPRVDEIVVVDGAYRWMAPVLAAMGRDPTRSAEPLRAALAPYEAKTRWINQLWDNEPAKRIAGYAACSHRWIWRMDADEVPFIDDAVLARFQASGHAVAEMELPLMIAPGLVRGTPGQPFERNAVLFDGTQIDAPAHLAYLWLVIPAAERQRIRPADPATIHPEPVAFTAHLTGWRPPATAVARARFYVLNWLREHGQPHPASPFRHDPQAGFAPMLQDFPADALTDTLMGHVIVAGLPELGGAGLMASPLSAAQDSLFTPLYPPFLTGLADLNQTMADRPRTLAAGDDYTIDLSTPAATAPFLRGDSLHFQFGAPLAAGRASITWLYPDAPFLDRADQTVTLDAGRMLIPLPSQPRPTLRRTLTVAAWPADGSRFVTMRSGL
jgi:hypothetical protein